MNAWDAVGRLAKLATTLVKRLWPLPKQKSPNPRDVAIAVSSHEAARKSSEATEAAARASRRQQD